MFYCNDGDRFGVCVDEGEWIRVGFHGGCGDGVGSSFIVVFNKRNDQKCC